MHWLRECGRAIQWGNSLRADIFKCRSLGYLLLLGLMVTLAVGLALFLVDPGVKSPIDGIWSAWVTMTHVGFGDVVPVSLIGRLLAAALILFGLALFSLFTAIVSVTLLGRNMDVVGGELRRIEQEASTIQGTEERILTELSRLQERLAAVEKLLTTRP